MSKEIEEMYTQLVRWYSRHSLTPKNDVERSIAERVAQGKTREQAIRELYEEENRFLEGLTTPRHREPPSPGSRRRLSLLDPLAALRRPSRFSYSLCSS